MPTKRYRPKIDKLFYIIWLPIVAIMLAVTVVLAVLDAGGLFIMIPLDLFVLYFLISSLVGYAELRCDALFIRYGFILKREIPYSKIRGVKKARKWYSDSMLALKNSIEHVDIKYNSFDVTCVSVKDNDAFIKELEERIHNGS